MRGKVLAGVAFVTASALVLFGATSAGAAEGTSGGDLSTVVDRAAEHVADQPGNKTGLRLDLHNATARGTGASVSVPFDSSRPVEVTSTETADVPPLTIGLPKNASEGRGARDSSNAVKYNGSDADSVVQTFEQGIRVATVIPDADSAKSYTYELPSEITPVINQDGSIALTASFKGKDDGELTVQYGTIDAPWAVDANGQNVPTHYVVSKGKLTQVVEHSRSNAFPVTADPTFWWGWNFFVSNKLHKKIVEAWQNGVTAVGIANLFVGYIPNPYVQLAVRLASALFAAGFLLFKMCNANGRGVILGQVTALGWLPPIGATGFIRNGYFCLAQ
jgi:hypothetical protein